MRPFFDADEDIGAPGKRYRNLYAQKIGADATGVATVSVVNLISGLSAGLRVVAGQLSTVTASDTVVTGLTTVAAVIASLDADPTDDPFMASASIGDQAGTPAAGSVLIKTWKNTGGTDPTPQAAGTFTKKVNWIAIGT